MRYTLGQVAKEAGCSKSTIQRAVKSGKISATRLDDNSYAIEPAELQRWFGSNGHRNGKMTRIATPDDAGVNHPEQAVSSAEIEGLRAQVALLTSERDDLRKRLDSETAERREKDRQLTALLTDQRTAPEPPRGFWARLRGR